MWNARVTAIIINWNLKETTFSCIQSLMNQDTSSDIILVDNGSRDGSVEYLSSHFPGLEIIPLPDNIGFGPACNRAIQKALQRTTCQFVLLINNDAVLAPDGLSRILQVADVTPAVGIFGPKVYYRDDPERIWYAGARQRRVVLAAAGTGRGQIDRGQFDKPIPVDYIFGTAMMIRRSIFEQVGLFDERFYLYLEDLDFCLRARRMGISLLFVPQARVWHTGSASTAHNLELRKYHYIKSSILFLKKHLSRAVIPLGLAFWSSVFLRMIVFDILRGDPPKLDTYWTALISSMTDIG